MEDFIYKHKKKIAIGLVVAFLVVIVVSIYNVIENNTRTATVEITVSPLIAKIKIDGEEYDATETAKIRPGIYNVEIYADGFVTKNIEIEALKDEVVEISLYLDPTEENKDWYKEHVWDGTARGDIMSDNAIRDFYTLQKKYPILNYVPYNTFTYAIKYENDCADNNGGICLVIDADFGYRRYAVQYLQTTGQNLADYYVKVKGYSLPFRQIKVEAPDNLEFDGVASGATMEAANVDSIVGVVNDYVEESFNLDGYVAKVGQIKNYDNRFFGVTLMVYDGGGSTVYDDYRMIVGAFDDGYRVLTNADIILSKAKNPSIPVELLRLVNNI